MDKRMKVSKSMRRALVVRQLMDKFEGRYKIDPAFVMPVLNCGRAQALKAIRQARFLAADDGNLVNYATRTTDYKVTMNGDAIQRGLTWAARAQAINTQKRNHARVTQPAEFVGQTAEERAMGKLARADALSAEADAVRISAFKELLKDEESR